MNCHNSFLAVMWLPLKLSELIGASSEAKTYPLYVASANDLRRVNTDHPFQAQFVNMEGWTIAVHQHHRRRKIKTAARENPGRAKKCVIRHVYLAIDPAEWLKNLVKRDSSLLIFSWKSLRYLLFRHFLVQIMISLCYFRNSIY